MGRNTNGAYMKKARSQMKVRFASRGRKHDQALQTYLRTICVLYDCLRCERSLHVHRRSNPIAAQMELWV